jgi:hypothetical protein
MQIHKILHVSESFGPQFLLHERQDLLQEKVMPDIVPLVSNLQTRYGANL